MKDAVYCTRHEILKIKIKDSFDLHQLVAGSTKGNAILSAKAEKIA